MLHALLFVFLASIVARSGWSIGNLLLDKFNQFTGQGMPTKWFLR
jgi:hypothetical protein